MVKSLTGNTLLFSVDGMYQVLAGTPNVDIFVMDSKKPHEELERFYKFLIKNLDKYDNVVIDNLSTFQRFWLNSRAKKTTSGMPERRDYAIIDRVLLDFVGSLKHLNKNILLLAHERKVEVTQSGGGVYTQHQPDVRVIDPIMGIVPIVGRLVVISNKETQEDERTIVLQPTQSTRAKDQLIGNLKTIGQMDLLQKLQNK